MAPARKHRLNLPPPADKPLPKGLSNQQIASLGTQAGAPPGPIRLPVNVPANVALGLGTQAGAPPDPAWLVRTKDDPLGWKSIAAHEAANPAPAAGGGGSPDLSWLGGAAWADPLFWQQIAQNVQTAGNNDLGYIGTRNQGLTDLGYNFTFDPNDPFTPTGAAPTVDTSNPFSQSMLLQTHFDAAKRGDTNNLASRGQLYSGALGNQLGLDQTAFDQGTDTLLKGAHALIDTAVRNHANNIIQYGPGGNAGQAGLDATGAAIGRQKPIEAQPPPTPPKPTTGATAAKGGSTSVGTPTNLPPVRAGTTPNLPFGGVVPGKPPKPYAPRKGPFKPYTGKSFVPFGGK